MIWRAVTERIGLRPNFFLRLVSTTRTLTDSPFYCGSLRDKLHRWGLAPVDKGVMNKRSASQSFEDVKQLS